MNLIFRIKTKKRIKRFRLMFSDDWDDDDDDDDDRMHVVRLQHI